MLAYVNLVFWRSYVLTMHAEKKLNLQFNVRPGITTNLGFVMCQHLSCSARLSNSTLLVFNTSGNLQITIIKTAYN